MKYKIYIIKNTINDQESLPIFYDKQELAERYFQQIANSDKLTKPEEYQLIEIGNYVKPDSYANQDPENVKKVKYTVRELNLYKKLPPVIKGKYQKEITGELQELIQKSINIGIEKRLKELAEQKQEIKETKELEIKETI